MPAEPASHRPRERLRPVARYEQGFLVRQVQTKEDKLMFYGKQVALWVSQSALDSMSEEEVKLIDSYLGEPIQKKTVAGGRLWFDPDCKACGDARDIMDSLASLSAEKGELYEVFINDPWETGWTKQVFTNREKTELLLDIQPVITFLGFPIIKGD